MKCLVSALLLIWVLSLGHCKILTKCGLTGQLSVLDFQRSFIGNWVCLVESESGKDTGKITNKADGTKNLGLFQINDRWCTYKKEGGKCKTKCEDLLDENLVNDATCAKMVYSEKGFRAWDGWTRSCYGRNLPIPRC